MITERELIAAIDTLERETLQRWIAQGWILPHREESKDYRFDPSDVARVRLICELHYDLRIEEDSLSVVLSLLDQLYDARRSLGTLMAAVKAEPKEVRTRIAASVERSLEKN